MAVPVPNRIENEKKEVKATRQRLLVCKSQSASENIKSCLETPTDMLTLFVRRAKARKQMESGTHEICEEIESKQVKSHVRLLLSLLRTRAIFHFDFKGGKTRSFPKQ
jgi:hypothetical protein